MESRLETERGVQYKARVLPRLRKVASIRVGEALRRMLERERERERALGICHLGGTACLTLLV